MRDISGYLVSQTKQVQIANALGSLASKPGLSVELVALRFNLPDLTLAGEWKKRKNRPCLKTKWLTSDQKERLPSRLLTTIAFSRDPKETGRRHTTDVCLQLTEEFANDILAEDDQLEEGNLVIKTFYYPLGFMRRNPRFNISGFDFNSKLAQSHKRKI